MDENNISGSRRDQSPSARSPERPPKTRWMGWLILLSAAGIFLYVSRPPKPAFQWESDVQAGLVRAKASDRPILLEFQTLGCPACEWMDRNVFIAPEVARALGDWVTIRIDGNAMPELSRQYGIEAFPTFLMLNSDGTVRARQVGSIPVEGFIALLQAAQAGPRSTVPATRMR